MRGASRGDRRRSSSSSTYRQAGPGFLFVYLLSKTYFFRCVFFLLGADSMMKFWKNLTGPCGAPTYLPVPNYPTYALWETKKEITGAVKVGYYTN